MVWVLIHRRKGKQKPRVRLQDGTLTPAFENPTQALKYIQKNLNGSSYIDIIKV